MSRCPLTHCQYVQSSVYSPSTSLTLACYHQLPGRQAVWHKYLLGTQTCWSKHSPCTVLGHFGIHRVVSPLPPSEYRMQNEFARSNQWFLHLPPPATVQCTHSALLKRAQNVAYLQLSCMVPSLLDYFDSLSYCYLVWGVKTGLETKYDDITRHYTLICKTILELVCFYHLALYDPIR